MHFDNVIAGLRAKANPEPEPKSGEVVSVDIPQPEPAAPLTENDLPAGMPLTNRLDKMTRYQAIWAIENGGAWIAYLQEQSEAGQDVSVIEYGEQPVQNGTVSDADAYKAICEVVVRVWNGLTDNMKRKTLRDAQIPEWVSTLEWAIKALPVGYERQRDILMDELETYQTKLTKPKKRKGAK